MTKISNKCLIKYIAVPIGVLFISWCSNNSYVDSQANELKQEWEEIIDIAEDQARELRNQAEINELIADQIEDGAEDAPQEEVLKENAKALKKDAELMNDRADALEELAEEKSEFYEDTAEIMEKYDQDLVDTTDWWGIKPEDISE